MSLPKSAAVRGGLSIASGVAPVAERFARKAGIHMHCFGTGLGSAEYVFTSREGRDRVARFCSSQVRGSFAKLSRAETLAMIGE